ncbi:MAG: hypothetical protein HZB25_13270 [Candidatus Eisenbacteria bacterium]|nr:hypothetical protein [Candidatus Eisenbacteria bacterium]
MPSNRLTWALLVLLAILPGAALSQCAGMGAGGHRHDADAASKADEKDQRMIRDILRDEGRRDLLLEAVFEDADFMQRVIDRVAQTSKLRQMVLESLGVSGEGEQAAHSDTNRSRQPRMKSGQETFAYGCPMHPEVKSNKPGKCPKCGMFLERAKPAGRGPGDSTSKGDQGS